MLTVEQVRKALEDRNLKMVAERTGLSYSTVYDLARGATENPSWETMRRLCEYLDAPVPPTQ